MNRPPQRTPYRMPETYIGEIVLWYEAGVDSDEIAKPALVKGVNHDNVHLKVFGDRDEDRFCVRHLGDPNAKEYDRDEAGAWSHCKKPQKISVIQPKLETAGAK